MLSAHASLPDGEPGCAARKRAAFRAESHQVSTYCRHGLLVLILDRRINDPTGFVALGMANTSPRRIGAPLTGIGDGRPTRKGSSGNYDALALLLNLIQIKVGGQDASQLSGRKIRLTVSY